MTPREFHNRLNGWQQIRNYDWEENWRRTRTLAHYVIPGGHWGKNVPNLYEEIKLPNDPKTPAHMVEITDEEMALRKYKIKKAYKAKMSQHFEDLIRKHYQPSWGPHPDELTKPKTDASPA